MLPMIKIIGKTIIAIFKTDSMNQRPFYYYPITIQLTMVTTIGTKQHTEIMEHEIFLVSPSKIQENKDTAFRILTILKVALNISMGPLKPI